MIKQERAPKRLVSGYQGTSELNFKVQVSQTNQLFFCSEGIGNVGGRIEFPNGAGAIKGVSDVNAKIKRELESKYFSMGFKTEVLDVQQNNQTGNCSLSLYLPIGVWRKSKSHAGLVSLNPLFLGWALVVAIHSQSMSGMLRYLICQNHLGKFSLAI